MAIPIINTQLEALSEKLTDIAEAITHGGSQGYKTYGVDIDLTNSNPSTSCTYVEDAVGMSAGSADWDDIFGAKPCLMVNGNVIAYLNKDNYAQDEDGNAVDITTLGNDVMVEFPKMGYKIWTSDDVTHIRLTNDPARAGYCYKPFSRYSEGDRTAFYYGAYKSYSEDSMMYSSSGKTPTGNETRATFRTQARNRGTGYAQNGWYQLVYLQVLYTIKYKNLNSQAALGQGYTASSHSAATNTGGTNAKGFNYGGTNDEQVKFLGIEDFWGNIWSWVDGVTTDASWNMILTHVPSNFDDATSGTNHESYATGVTANVSDGYQYRFGDTDKGFATYQSGGSNSTYFCDYATLFASCVAYFGGRWNGGADAGAFTLNVSSAASRRDAGIASRLMYV